MKKSICIIATLGLLLSACGTDQETNSADPSEETDRETPTANSKDDTTPTTVTLSEEEQIFADEYIETIKKSLASNGAEGIITDEELTCYGQRLVAGIGINVLEQYEINPFRIISASSAIELTDEDTKVSLTAEKDCLSYESYFTAAVAWDGYGQSDATCVANEFNKEDYDARTEMLLEHADSDLDDDRKNELEAAFDVMESKFEASIEKCGAEVDADRFAQPVQQPSDTNEDPVTTEPLDR